MVNRGVESAARRDKTSYVEREHDRACGNRSGETGDKGCPAGEKRRQAAMPARR